jgi:predicted O-linked N-acetylglucosamine transferase (SPINDLY family)
VVAGWRNILRQDDRAVARQIREDGIDVLVDLSGHTDGNRMPLFALKPAPVQCTWLGYVSTTGLPTVDYVVADRYVLPPEHERYFVEKPYRLPHSYLCFTKPQTEIEVGPLPAIEKGQFTFGCFNNLVKLNDEVLDLWIGIMQAVPNSRLFLKNRHIMQSRFEKQLVERFAAAGISPDRLLISGEGQRVEYLLGYNWLDLALDPFPYGGGTTTIESLWMGVPVVSLRGDRWVGRVSDSILSTLGLSELVTTTKEDYARTAIALASDLPRLAELRASLRPRLLASPLMDAPGFARDLETAYRAMWSEWCGTRIQKGAA